MIKKYRSLLVWLAVFVVTALGGNVVLGGASPSQWVIVVNGNSMRSRTIANHYCHWRNIPSRNIIVLDDVPISNQITVEVFKEKILVPLLLEVGKRNLTTHIQGIAYSSDFPLEINLSTEPAIDGPFNQVLTRVGSINGLTYLYKFVRDFGNTLNLNNNWYAGRPCEALFGPPLGDPQSDVEVKKKQLLEAKKFEELGFLLDEQLSRYPDQYPLAYQSAQAWAEAGQQSKAIQQLQRAIETGWSYSKYIQLDEHLKSLHEFNRFQTLVRGCENDSFTWTPAMGFDARRNYAPNGVSTYKAYENAGVTYMLSMVLGVCHPAGNSEKEVLAQLKRSIDADYSQPDGTFFFAETGDVRTKCRQPGFAVAIEKLREIGKKGVIIKDSLPRGADCAGLMTGVQDFSWITSRSRLLPGAIAENLTSLGGAMDATIQTKLTEFLKHGAAASSGTVLEPYSIQAKFPHPTMHYYSAAGLTCAEAFYSSIQGPYQLLIAGDPLCAPFALAPRFRVEGMHDGMVLDKTLIADLVYDKSPVTVPPRVLSIHVNGEFKGAKALPNTSETSFPIRIPTDAFSVGAHEIRFVTGDGTRIGTRFEKSFWVVSGPDYNQIKLTGPASWKSSDKKPLVVEVIGSDSDAVIDIRNGFESIYTVQEGQNRCELPLAKLGRGPVRLQAISTIGTTETASLPITVMIE